MSAPGYRLTPLGPIAISGTLSDPNNVSGIAFVGDFALVVCDETAQIDVLKRTATGFAVQQPIRVDKKGECDLEALVVSGTTVYAVGGHSRARPRLKPDDSYAEAQQKMATVKDDPARDMLVRFVLTAEGTALGLEKTSLRAAIEDSPVLKPFTKLPGKENGVDIEGLAARGDVLVVGFRGPVLRENYVPVLLTKFGKDRGEVVFVNLGGRGVRDLAAIAGGFLILAGPVGDGPGGYQIYRWNGGDCLPGAKPAGVCELLCELPVGPGLRPEGLAVRKEDAAGFEFVLVCDGVANGNPTAYRLERQ